jgi:hypothetical protein
MDIRDTEVKELPESFWKIKALRRVVVCNDNLNFPPSTGHLKLNVTDSVLPTTATEPEQSTGEAENPEPEESVHHWTCEIPVMAALTNALCWWCFG